MTIPDAELSAIRTRLETRLRQLQTEIETKLEQAAQEGDAVDRVADAGESSVVDDATTNDFADARRDIAETKDIRAALERMDAGDYGTCIDCGEEIPVERLRAQPTALRCITDQTRWESQHGTRPSAM